VNGWNFPISLSEDPFLHYYFHSDALFGLSSRRSREAAEGFAEVPRVRYKWAGWQYNPAYIAWWGIINLQCGCLSPFEAAVKWLHHHAVERERGVVWPYSFDWIEGKATLRAPWISAMAQGLAISALVRSWRLRGSLEDLLLAKKASEVFWVPVEEGGLMDASGGMCFLEEYPARPFPRVLDGFCFALLGIHDLEVELGNHYPYSPLLNRCLDTLEAFLPRWDFLGLWSWYGTEGFLCSLQYQTLNRIMLLVLYRLTGREMLKRYAERWNPIRLTRDQRMLVSLACRATLTLRRTQYNRIRRTHYGSHTS
jgi:hypothetical protein